jgi:DNA-binding CsgD family transcriptional regulator
VVEAVVGRETELDAVERFLDAVPAGMSGLVLEGTPGSGKSTLWREAGRRAQARGYRVLSTRPAEAEAKLSFSGLADLLRGIAQSAFDALPQPQREAIEIALARASGEAERGALFAGVVALFSMLAVAMPLVVAVDDVQWLDLPSAAAVVFALRRLTNSRVAFLGTIRADHETGPRSFMRALGENPLERVRVGPLSLGALHHLIKARFGRSFPRPTLVRIERASGGNPFSALEIARQVLESGEPAAGEPLPISDDLEDVIRARIGRLPAETRAALMTVASLTQPTVRFVSAAALAAAEDAALVRITSRGQVFFVHPLYASAVYRAASSHRRRSEHERLAALVEDPEERARHLALAADGPDNRVAMALSRAAAGAAARGAPDAAGELGRLAIELTPQTDGMNRSRRQIALGEWLLAAGDNHRAREVLESALRSMDRGRVRCDALLVLTAVLWEDNKRAALDAAEAALTEAADRDQVGSAHRAIAFASGDIDLARAARHADAALQMADPEADPLTYVDSVFEAAWRNLLLGLGTDENEYQRALEIQARSQTARLSSAPPLWMTAHDDFDGASSYWEVMLRLARERGDESEISYVVAMLAQSDLWRGSWPAASRGADLAVELAELADAPSRLAHALFARALVDAHRGDFERSRQACREVLAIAQTRADPWFECAGASALGLAELTAGDPARADAAFSRAERAAEAMGMREPVRFRFQGDQVETVVALGDLDRAEGLVERLEERARIFPRPWTLAMAARCRGLVHAARGELDAALASLDQALAHHARLEMPFELARTLLIKGEVHRRRREKRLAGTAMAEALAIFDRLGAVQWAARARGEMARVQARRAPVGLTATEDEVAVLAASGRTNREIASALFMSPKTVEKRLASAYGKLGIHTRAELGGYMADRRPNLKS